MTRRRDAAGDAAGMQLARRWPCACRQHLGAGFGSAGALVRLVNCSRAWSPASVAVTLVTSRDLSIATTAVTPWATTVTVQPPPVVRGVPIVAPEKLSSG